MELTTSAVDHLAHRVAADGVDAHWREVVALVGVARASGVAPVVLDALSDPDEPTIVRQRAFGIAAVAIERARRAGTTAVSRAS